MGKLIKKITFIIVLFFISCENKSITNKEINLDSLDTNLGLSLEVEKKNQTDSIIRLFNSMPVLEFKTALSSRLIRKEKRGKLIYNNDSWKVLYEADSLTNPDIYENAAVNLEDMSIKYVFSMDVYQIKFFYSYQRKKLIALTVLSENYTSGMPSDILFIHEIGDKNEWTEVSKNLLNKKEIVERFISDNHYNDIFNDLFNIQIGHPAKLIITPNLYYLKSLGRDIHKNHPFFHIAQSKLNDSVVYSWSDSLGRFEIKQ